MKRIDVFRSVLWKSGLFDHSLAVVKPLAVASNNDELIISKASCNRRCSLPWVLRFVFSLLKLANVSDMILAPSPIRF